MRHARPTLRTRLDRAAWTPESWLEEILPGLLTELGAEGPLTLILDGLECVTDAAAVRSLEDFPTRLPQGFRIILSTRHLLGRPLPTLRARGLIAELDQRVLAFTREETQALLTELIGPAATADAWKALHEATEGWAAGLFLMGHALARVADEADREARLARGGQAVAEYLATEVLQRLTTEQREFLLRTSVLDELSVGPCQALAVRPRRGQRVPR
ncbi:hypothetical protein [Streptomyces cadmiisoli]|uniref:hypothetical protein n=1 Tax=Streptomyces cadmiisoli TaxID=2184053 RepID=UPI0036519B9B